MTAVSAPAAPEDTALLTVPWPAAITAAAVTCVAVASVYLTQPIFPEIAAHFGVADEQARYAFTGASLAYALSFFLFGPLTDRVPLRFMGFGGAVALAALLAVAAFSPGFGVFVALLGLAGAAAAAVPSAMIALMPRLAPPALKGMLFGLVIGASVAGITLGRSVTGVVAEWTDWRTAVVSVAVLNLIGAAAMLTLPRLSAPAGTGGPVRSAYGAVLGLFRLPATVRLLALGVCLFFGYLGVATFLTYRLQAAPFEYDVAAIGLLNLAGLVGVVGAPAAGRLVPRIGAPAVVFAGLGTVLAGIALLGFAAHPTMIAAGTLLLFAGVFACQPAVLVMLAAAAPPGSQGGASSLYMLVCLLAGSAASAALGPVWTNSGWTGVVLTGIAAVLAAAVLASAARSRRPVPQPSQGGN
ncbi:MFS transporter [Glycomyces luteolus]|uniref:MFS transporter n=1 Tax=Glycomyces luteolus TaxID=2670330 RepID=A0A9X3P542_9ACTN|nr:MFS transporter [Glycomyces luteolus]MDA1358878.1 MFS transporter [Glycomyces luteolus]